MFDHILKELRLSKTLLDKTSSALRKRAEDKELLQKARESLKDKKYKDPENNKEISFSTAYNRKVPQAQQDLQKALSSIKSKNQEEGSIDTSGLNEEQVDLLERIAKGKKTSDMSLVEQRTLRESLALLFDAQDTLKKDGVEEPLKTAEPKKKKQYAKKVKKKVVEKGEKVVKALKKEKDLPEDTTIEDIVDVDSLAETHSEDAKAIDTTLKKQESSRKDKLKKKFQEQEKKVDKDRDSILKSLEKSIESFSEKAIEDIEDKIKDVKKSLQNKSHSEEKLKDLEEQLEDLEYEKDIRELNAKNTQAKYQKSLKGALENIPDFDDEQTKKLSESYAKMGGDLVRKLEDIEDLKSFVDDNLSELEDLDESSEDYAENVGKLMALKTMKEEVIGDPTFGFSPPAKNSSPEFLEEYKEFLGEEQRKKFNSFTPEERKSASSKLAYEKEDLMDILDDPNTSPEKREEVERRLFLVKETESALNTSRILNGEDPIDGYYYVDENLLNIAKTEDGEYNESLVKAISVISKTDVSNEEMRSIIDTALKDMPLEQWESIVGDSEIYQSMKGPLDPLYCPVHPENIAKGVSGETVSRKEDCPKPVSQDMINTIKDTINKSYLDIQTSFKAQSKKKSLTTRKNKNLSKFLHEHQDDFMEKLISGVGKDGTPITKEEKEDFMNFFFMKIRGLSVLNLDLQGEKITGVRDIMRQLNRVRKLDGAEKIRATEELKKVFLDLMEKDPIEKQSSFNNLFIDYTNTYGGVFMHKKSTTYQDYQKRSKDFKVGMKVYYFWEGNSSQPGVVVAVYPSIGMVDVEYPHGSQRIPIEELIIVDSGDTKSLPESTVPGGTGVVPVSTRVANNYLKKAIYWRNINRRYKLCKGEDPNKPNCPKCKTQMGKTVYKRRDSQSERLFACPSCLFVIKSSDIEGAN